MISLDLRLEAVRHLFQADKDLRQVALPFANFEYRIIYWQKIDQSQLSDSQKTAILLAKGIWCDQISICRNLLFTGLGMDVRLRTAALQAIAIYWGLIPHLQTSPEVRVISLHTESERCSSFSELLSEGLASRSPSNDQ